MTDISHALYRKYRPENFDAVRNQDHIVSVLKGALAKRLIPHALLFTGSRGTGKTTVARIFAHELGATDNDIYEIDAASNRGIDDIRELKESVHILPFQSPYKVYIIDEVHMLSKDAFNALLKTLEEPPEYVIFILATTEKDKVLDTIISRCQVFEFRSPTRVELREVVMNVAKQEKFKLDTGTADIIALCADGSYRDALGITQKVMMASGDTTLTSDEVAEIVGAPRNILLQEMVHAFASKDTARGLTALNQAYTSNVDMKLFMRLLLERIRTVMVLRHNPSHAELLLEPYGEEDKSILRGYAQDLKVPLNSHLMVRLIEVSAQIGKTSISVLPLEVALIDHCS